MLEALTELNQWITDHQLLVVSIGVPILSIIVAGLTAFLSGKAAAKSQNNERDLQKIMKLSEFRQSWIDELRNDLAKFQGTLLNRGPYENAVMQELAVVKTRIIMRMNPNDSDFLELMEAMTASLMSASKDTHSSEFTNLEHLSQKILKREWDRLKVDLLNSGEALKK